MLLAAFYISTAISFSKTVKNRLIFLGLLLLYYFLIEYFSMARGYGMSAAFILASIFVYKNQEKFTKPQLWLSYLFLLAIYANYVAIPFVMVFATYIFVVDYRLKLPEVPKKTRNWIVGLFVLSIYGFFPLPERESHYTELTTKTFLRPFPWTTFLVLLGS